MTEFVTVDADAEAGDRSWPSIVGKRSSAPHRILPIRLTATHSVGRSMGRARRGRVQCAATRYRASSAPPSAQDRQLPSSTSRDRDLGIDQHAAGGRLEPGSSPSAASKPASTSAMPSRSRSSGVLSRHAGRARRSIGVAGDRAACQAIAGEHDRKRPSRIDNAARADAKPCDSRLRIATCRYPRRTRAAMSVVATCPTQELVQPWCGIVSRCSFMVSALVLRAARRIASASAGSMRPS